MFIINRHDHEHDREPSGLLFKCFIGGVFSTILSLAFSSPLSLIKFDNHLFSSFYTAFFSASFPEELAKWIILHFIVRKSLHFNQYYDGIIYAVFVSMGFALLENILYVMEGGFSVAIIRAILAVPGHMLDAILMGYFYSLARFENTSLKTKYLFLSLLAPITAHGIYDFILIYSSGISKLQPIFAGLLSLVFGYFNIKLWKLCLKKIKVLKANNAVISPI
jgi:RsiW-degrading membrane proteinase PrsW (M82 family)